MTLQSKMNPMFRDSHDNFGPLLRWIGLFIAKYQKFRRGFFRIVKIIGPKILKMVKNAPILLIFGVLKQLMKRIHHTKFEPNRSIFWFGSGFFRTIKMLKNAPILLKFGVMNSFHELFSHTKYEQNRSIFDLFENFGPNYFADTEKCPSKFLICCSK